METGPLDQKRGNMNMVEGWMNRDEHTDEKSKALDAGNVPMLTSHDLLWHNQQIN